jgi:hypothetical protein
MINYTELQHGTALSRKTMGAQAKKKNFLQNIFQLFAFQQELSY